MKDTKEKLSVITITLHWIVAITVITMIVVGIYMSENEVFELYPIHKSIGFLIFFVILIRVFWRMTNGWLIPVNNINPIENKLAKIAHWLLIITTVIMPISGFISSGAGGYGVSVFGLEIIASNFDLITREAIPHNASLAKFMHDTHEIVGWSMVVIISLHVIAAIKHHFINKDRTLKRMLGK